MTANPNTVEAVSQAKRVKRVDEPTLTVLSQLPVIRMPPWASIHLTALMGASCWATCCGCPVEISSIRAVLSAPPEKTLVPSYLHVLECRRYGVWNVRYSNKRSKRVLGVGTSPFPASGLYPPKLHRVEPNQAIQCPCRILKAKCKLHYYPSSQRQGSRPGVKTRVTKLSHWEGPILRHLWPQGWK